MATTTAKTTSKTVDTTIRGEVQTAQALVVNPADWSLYLRLKSEASALDKRVKALEQSFAFPSPDTLATLYKAVPGETLSFPIVNGNQDHLGKMTVFHFPGCTMPEGWRKRIG